MNNLLRTGSCPLIGVIHLPPLPGSPMDGPGMEGVVEAALRDARTLATGGAAGVIVENIGDAPFSADRVEPHVVAMLAVVARSVVQDFGDRLVVGINALRNDALGAVGAAAASGASFVRVNVHTGVMATDQGLIEGRARDTLLYRKQLGVHVAIAADVLVKHAVPVGNVNLVQLAQDTFYRGGADVLIHTGTGTGKAVDMDALRLLRESCPNVPFWVGSGVNAANAAELATLCDGAIVGTYLHRDGDLSAPLELARVREIASLLS